jgi:hypothetical protein
MTATASTSAAPAAAVPPPATQFRAVGVIIPPPDIKGESAFSQPRGTGPHRLL